VKNAWLLLFIAGLLETAWAVGLKYSNGFTRLWPSVFTAVACVASFYLLALAIRSLPLGTAYAVWTGIGALGAVLWGILFLNEPATTARIVCIVLILSGIAGLRFAGGH
jgi:quaternary ammonium compound-resistance protein SugE